MTIEHEDQTKIQSAIERMEIEMEFLNADEDIPETIEAWSTIKEFLRKSGFKTK